MELTYEMCKIRLKILPRDKSPILELGSCYLDGIKFKTLTRLTADCLNDYAQFSISICLTNLTLYLGIFLHFTLGENRIVITALFLSRQ